MRFRSDDWADFLNEYPYCTQSQASRAIYCLGLTDLAEIIAGSGFGMTRYGVQMIDPIPPLPLGYDGTFEGFKQRYPYATKKECEAACKPNEYAYGVLAYFDKDGKRVQQKIVPYPGPLKKKDIVGTPVERWEVKLHWNAERQRAMPQGSGQPTAKSIGLELFEEGISRDLFVKKMEERGVKEVTAKTLFSDIKAGRIK